MLKTPSLHWNKSESGAKEVDVFVSAWVILYTVYDITFADTKTSTSLAPLSILFQCKEGVLSVNVFLSTNISINGWLRSLFCELPDCMIALPKYFQDPGATRCIPTLAPPADSPKIVTYLFRFISWSIFECVLMAIYLIRVATKISNIILNPFHCQTLIQQASIVSYRIIQTWHESKRTKSRQVSRCDS